MCRSLQSGRILRGIGLGATIAVGLMVAAFIVIALAGQRLNLPLPPWFPGRGPRLRPVPYVVVVGPVDASKGIPGLLEVGMTRREVLARLGSPLVPRLTPRAAQKLGLIDPEDVADDLFQGVFAWVQYGARDRVISIAFDLKWFRTKLGGEQQVLLSHAGHTYLLHQGLSQREVLAQFTKQGLGPTLRVQGAEIILEGTGTCFDFDDSKEHLRAVSVIY